MKTLSLIRHAKSSWSDPNLPDKQRPLNKRGQRDLPRMGKLLHQNGFRPDLVLCSTSIRTLQTLEGLRKELALDDEQIKFVEQLYEADAQHLLGEIMQRPDSVEHLVVIAHNPGLTDLINLLCDLNLSNLPTCGIAQIRVECLHWSDIQLTPGTLQTFLTPKSLA